MIKYNIPYVNKGKKQFLTIQLRNSGVDLVVPVNLM
jgi:hypothetical protein